MCSPDEKIIRPTQNESRSIQDECIKLLTESKPYRESWHTSNALFHTNDVNVTIKKHPEQS